jgi:hypothetical protein
MQQQQEAVQALCSAEGSTTQVVGPVDATLMHATRGKAILHAFQQASTMQLLDCVNTAGPDPLALVLHQRVPCCSSAHSH